MKKNILICLIFSTSSLILGQNAAFANCLIKDCFTFGKDKNKREPKHYAINYAATDELSQVLKKDKIEQKEIFENIFISDRNISNLNNKQLSYEIEADIQYTQNNIFYAEGNVIIFLSNGTFKSDKISYDRDNKIFKVHSKFTFISGDQYLEGDYIEYDFLKSSGFLDNVYGVINLDNLSRDLNLKENFSEESNCSKKQTNILDLPSEVSLLNKDNIRLQNKLNKSSFNLNFEAINKWRFKSDKIKLEENKWNSELIYFTNDPYNNPQILLKSEGFGGEINDNRINFSSNSTKVILDDKFSIPLGKRTIKDEEATINWGIGYSYDNKDGFYIQRNYDPIDLSRNFRLDLTSYLLIQRAIQGESNAFRKNKSSLASDNVKTDDINFLDYFALNTNIYGKLSNWDLNINSDLKSLNAEKLYDSFSSELSFQRIF